MICMMADGYTQRTKKRKECLDARRKERLDELGFDWNKRKASKRKNISRNL